MDYTILSGPSKFDLMTSLFMGNSRDRQEVIFRIEPVENAPSAASVKIISRTVSFTINSVEREDGSGERWNIVGYATGYSMRAFYDTNTRKGKLSYRGS